MSAGHDHGAATTHRWRLAVAFAITVTILVAEVIGALWTGSLALLVDAGHMLTDAAGLLMALVAASLVLRPPTPARTWGFRRAEVLAAGAQAAILLGVGVYAFVEGVLAHADGDVVIHALCDAILGALALGDIGTHFPASAPRWKDADSRMFLRHCRQLAAERGWVLGNADITVICERPRVGPHVGAIRESLAADLQTGLDAVSVKATTTETLGFTGRGEGIAAMAACLLVRA